MKEVRETSENVLLLDGGNTIFGERALAQETQGKAIVEAMNLLGYDAMVLSDQDFRLGLDVLRQRMEEAEFSILSANVVYSGTDQLFATPYVIKEIGDHKAAIIGLTNQEAASAADGDIVVLDPLETLRDLMDEVSEEADVVIVLSHLGKEVDLQIAGEVQGIDLIVGGQSRDVLHPPLWVEASGTVIVQAGYQGQRIGVVSLEIDSQGTVTGHQGQVVFLLEELADDPEMRAFLDQYK
ncbi:MAG: bifunctional metallophosphatase/5'-nucleotidase [Anaerolineales bacterium]|nr:bifunctional metallophosphatase/5'-nucleotidase [Anaerolineales bacterium]